MSVLEFVASVIRALAWPLSFIVVAWILRDQLRGLLGRLREVRHRDTALKFADTVSEAESKVEEALQGTHRVPLEDAEREEFAKLAEISPRAAILEAWIRLENAIRVAGEYQDIPISARRSVMQIAQQLQRRDLLSPAFVDALRDLSALRNAAVHDRGFEVDPNLAAESAFLALTLESALAPLGRSNPDPH